LAIAGYRSFRDVRIALARLSIVTGANGSGKSSLYRSLRLLADVAQGRIIQSLAAEGGLPSTLWAGPATIAREVRQGVHPVQGLARQTPVSLKLGFASADYGYAIDLGLPAPLELPSKFEFDPIIKAESLWTGERLGRANEFAKRRGPAAQARDASGAWRAMSHEIATFDSMVTQCGDPREAPELLLLRERMRDWRFYDHFRTDAEAPARRRQIGTYTPVLASDGADLAAAVQTILEIGDADALHATIEDAFPSARLSVTSLEGSFELSMRQHGLLRALRTAELSDGTLRYLLLVAALLSPRPPALMVLNEPETSLHPDLLAPLGRLIAAASARSQVIVVSHSAALIAALDEVDDARMIVLEKQFGETIVADHEAPLWTWPAR
jgi:predicted ATPase